MDNLKLIYPDADIVDDKIIIKVVGDVSVMFNIDIENNEYHAWDLKGTNHTEKLKQAIIDVNSIPHDEENKLALILQYFKDNFNKTILLNSDTINENDIDFPEYDGTVDILWNLFKKQFNVNTKRNLKIYTYGTTYMLDPPKDCQQIFDSSILRGSHSNPPEKYGIPYKSLLKLRGTSLKVQQEIRGGELYKSFMSNIVNNIETNDLHTIAIVCKFGRHRSVSCAEMLVHLYPNRTVDHLTIDV